MNFDKYRLCQIKKYFNSLTAFLQHITYTSALGKMVLNLKQKPSEKFPKSSIPPPLGNPPISGISANDSTLITSKVF